MKSQVLALVAVLLGTSACQSVRVREAVVSPKTPYIESLMDIVPPETMLAQMSQPYAMLYNMPGRQERAHANFMRNLDVAKVRSIIGRALDKHFTEEELKSLAEFYSTPAGRACMAKSAAFAAEVVPACMHEATRAYGKTAYDAAHGRLIVD